MSLGRLPNCELQYMELGVTGWRRVRAAYVELNTTRDLVIR